VWKVSLCTVLVGLSLCLLLATAKNNSRGQGAKVACGGVSVPVGMYTVCVCFPVTGAQVPITSYTCTQPTTVSKEQGQCTVSDGLRTCEMKGGAHPNLLSSSGILGLYIHGIVTDPLTLTPLWCWTFPKDGVLIV